jgi:hypothetical protein
MKNIIHNYAKRLGLYLTLATPYAVLTATLYLQAYWSHFYINAFSYLSIQEIITHSIPALIAISGGVCAIIVVQKIIRFEKLIEKKPGNRVQKSLIFIILYPIIVAILLALILFIIRRDWGWERVALLAITVSFVFIFRWIGLFSEIEHDGRRLWAISIFVLAPYSAWCQGSDEARYIDERTLYKIIDSKQLKFWSEKDNSELIYLGKLGDDHFILNKDKDSVIIAKISDFKLLEIKTIDKRKDLSLYEIFLNDLHPNLKSYHTPSPTLQAPAAVGPAATER